MLQDRQNVFKKTISHYDVFMMVIIQLLFVNELNYFTHLWIYSETTWNITQNNFSNTFVCGHNHKAYYFQLQ